ncbi:MAG TPA: hypothetical protein VFM90_01115 [Cyclobacteriaceae bacterium]|nr:hypothetical protein [Cyclobacteriaceae bacterium]
MTTDSELFSGYTTNGVKQTKKEVVNRSFQKTEKLFGFRPKI